MDDQAIAKLPNMSKVPHDLANIQEDQNREMINLKYEGAMNLHQIDEQSLEEVESTSSISESSQTTSDLSHTFSDSQENQQRVEESKNDKSDNKN